MAQNPVVVKQDTEIDEIIDIILQKTIMFTVLNSRLLIVRVLASNTSLITNGSTGNTFYSDKIANKQGLDIDQDSTSKTNTFSNNQLINSAVPITQLQIQFIKRLCPRLAIWASSPL
ncbi:MAG: hypothetical protein WAZ77_16595 [Candidatus Nitrosopolaris sp.]|jgi:hypothetical protein